MPTRRFFLLALVMFGTACGDAPHRLGASERRAAIAALATQIETHYIDAAAARRIGALLRARERAGDYHAIRDDAALAQRLSSDLLQASHDAHLRVTPLTALPWWRRLRDHAGVDSYTKIAADIGYIDVTSFIAPDRSAKRYAKAFGKLADSKTIIIDLRNNEGGDADGLQLLASYVVDRPIHYANLARRDGSTEARWAFPQLAAQPYLEQLTILIGPRTSMEAENFAFAMQAWKRAAVVGSRSAGLASASRAYPIVDYLAVHIPDARVTLPLTRTGWPGGVVPDLVTRSDALREAKRHILQDRLAHVTTPMGRSALLAMLKEL
ncbi:S41 family peptidase [Massilia sp. S19_KUP03_FR1]|uniref:S41 family peptidase n=1 Tax=Massilia sp. S19_KUP03_FR1 TaxID=3025503 RepID=UPI002FCD7E8A